MNPAASPTSHNRLSARVLIWTVKVGDVVLFAEAESQSPVGSSPDLDQPE